MKTGQFFISPSCESNILDNELVKDGILGYEIAGYFITHDIYEEGAISSSSLLSLGNENECSSGILLSSFNSKLLILIFNGATL
jgi:hypothetical protein